jgi:hypothetical protein
MSSSTSLLTQHRLFLLYIWIIWKLSANDTTNNGLLFYETKHWSLSEAAVLYFVSQLVIYILQCKDITTVDLFTYTGFVWL